MKKRVIKLNESTLREIVKRVIKESMTDSEYAEDFAYGRECMMKELEYANSLIFSINVNNGEIIDDEEDNDDWVSFFIIPKLSTWDGEDFDIYDLDYDYNGQATKEEQKRLHPFIYDFIEKNYRALCDRIESDGICL